MFKLRNISSSPFIVAILLFYFSTTYFVWHLPYKNILDLIFTIIVVAISVKNRKKLDYTDVALIVLFVFTWLFFMLKLYEGGRNIFGMLEHVPICLFCLIPLLNKQFGEKVINNYINIYALFILLSMTMWLLMYVIPIPNLGTIEHYQEPRLYDCYPFLVVEQLSLDSFRFYGLFDEPGIVGTTGVALLCILKFNFKDKRTWIIFLSGILSMSFFFYTSVLVYSLLYFGLVKRAIPQTVLLALFFFLFYQITKDNVIFDDVIWARFQWDQDTGQFAGDNRINAVADAYFDSIKGTYEYYFGVRDLNAYWKIAEGSSSYKNIIALYGIVFLVPYCLFFVILSYKYKKSLFSFILFGFIFFLNMYQRSNIYSVLWMFLYSAMLRDYNINNKPAKATLN